jgi:hypothetical protein
MANSDPSDETRRILAMDGGGLYGLTTALWLKKLCERNESFLKEDDVFLFAGCSAGAFNALLLAREKNPRDFVLSGRLEEIWRQPGPFSNSNPLTAWLSLFQITAWLGAGDFLQFLQSLFGDMTLGDLPGNVFISSFNWTGDRNVCDGPPPGPCGADPWTQWAAACGCAGPPTWPVSPNAFGAGLAGQRSWRPKFFKNFPDSEPDRRCRVVDVAYAACTMPGVRAILNGFGDGGNLNPCPAAEAVAAMIELDRQQGWIPEAGLGDLPEAEAVKDFFDDIAGVCRHLRMLSLGVGARSAAYWLRRFDFSSAQFGMYPTNPLAGNWYPPSTVASLDAPTEDAVFIARCLLSRKYFHRMNPGILDVPTLPAMILARDPCVRQLLIQQIYQAVDIPLSREAVKSAAEFLEDGWYQ